MYTTVPKPGESACDRISDPAMFVIIDHILHNTIFHIFLDHRSIGILMFNKVNHLHISC